MVYPTLPQYEDRSRLIRDYMPLIHLLVERMVPHVPAFMSRDDMQSAAMVGLIEAANKYDPAKGTLFKTFAEHRIRGAILDEMRKLDWFSRGLREKQSRVSHAILELERELGRDPDEEEVAEAMDLSLEEYRQLLTQVSHLGCVSLNETLDDSDEGRCFLDNLMDSNSPTPLEVIEKQELTGVVASLLAKLSEKERMVISLYYYEELTQKEIAEVLGLTEGRISQLHSQALLKLRVKLQRSRDFD